ncbi:MAG: hypothetical protein AABX93_03825 [Nanoarchaeota archaeon]
MANLKSILVGSLVPLTVMASSPVFSNELKQEISNDKILAFVEITRHRMPSLEVGWDNNGKKGVYRAWDIDGDGNFDLLVGYKFIPGTIREIGEYFTGTPELLPSEIMLNLEDPEHYDTTKGDIFLKRNPDGKYVREVLVEGKET